MSTGRSSGRSRPGETRGRSALTRLDLNFTDAGVLIGNGTGAVQVTGAGTAGHVLTSGGPGVDPTFQPAAAGYSDEQAQDAVGAMLDASLVYVDATPLLQRAALTGDVTASAGSNSTTIAADTVTYAKIQNVSATDKVLGRSTAGAGDVEEIACTAAGRALIDDADAAAQRATLAIGSILPPTFPCSCFPVSSNAFSNVHVGAGANAKQLQGLGIAASIAADTVWRLQWQLPMTLPPGTLKLRLIGVANAPTASKDAKIKVKWASVAVGVDYSSATLSDEHPTTPDTVTWATTDGDKYKELKVTLDAATAAAGNFLVMDLTFLTASWTLDKVSTWLPSLVWE